MSCFDACVICVVIGSRDAAMAANFEAKLAKLNRQISPFIFIVH